MKTITFYSYKGGVGRSLALSNIAKRLSEFGKKVCLIDFDIEAPGLHHKFKQNLDPTSIKNGLVDYIYDYSEMGKIPTTISEYVTKISFENKNNSPIDLIAAGNVYTNEYWKKLSSIDWVKLFYKEDSQGVAFFIDLKEKIKKELKPDFLLIDSRTGITEVSGITMSILADEIVLLAARNDENIEGIKQVTKTLVNPQNNVFGKIPKINYVLSRIPYFSRPEEKQREISVKNNFLKRINSIDNLENKIDKVFIIHSDQSLELNEKFMIGYEHERNEKTYNSYISARTLANGLKMSPIALDYLELFEELVKGKLSTQDKIRFNNIKESEFLLKLSKSEENLDRKIEILRNAIELNSTSDETLKELSLIYAEKDDYEQSIIFIEKALTVNPNNLNYLCDKGFYLDKLEKTKDAKKIFENILKQDKTHYGAIHNLGHIYYNAKKFENALSYNMKLVDYYPDYSGAFNSVANTLRRLGRYDSAFEYIYKALEISPQDMFCTGTLAEIYAEVGNEKEFFKNLELSFAFGMTTNVFETILTEEPVYKKYFKNQKFISLLEKYNLHINIEKYLK